MKSNLNGRLKAIEKQFPPPGQLRVERRAGLVFVYWGNLLVRVIGGDLWDAI